VPAPGLPERARAVLETGAPVSNLLWEASTASPPAPLNLTISRMEASEPGEGRSLLITLKDLTELERLRAASQACERRYYGLLQDVEAIVWEAQSDPFGFLFVSQKAQTLLGYPVERWLTERDFLGAHLHPEDRAVRSLLTDAIPDDRAQEFDCRLLGAGRRVVWLHVTFRALPDSSGRSRARLRGIMVDVTALKLAEHQQARYNLELEQLAHAAAHHLQEPVRTVASFAQLLVRRYHSRLDSQADQFLELLAGGAARMQRLIADLLSYLQVAQQPLDLGPIDAETVFHDAVQALHQTLEASAATVGHDPLPSLHADPRQLQKLFESLLDNAVKFRGPEPPRVHVSVEDTPAEWLFRVRDNGIGIDPLYHDRIFGIFQRLHGREQYPGTGIGLALCRRILERHYGRLWVESEPGQGAAFCFTVPRHPA
jgi:signal transduction histidine kinase